MALEQMFPGIPFSPLATLTNNIGAGETNIEVSDVSAFPDAPNFATIGIDETAETILYSAKTSNSLSGCIRGVEGTARSWVADSPIARNFTNEDYMRLVGNINNLIVKGEIGNADEIVFDDGETFQEKLDSGTLRGQEGPQGEQGSIWLQGTTVPGSELGRVNDWYINTETSDCYEKTDETTWELRLNTKGEQGIPGMDADKIYFGTSSSPGGSQAQIVTTVEGDFVKEDNAIIIVKFENAQSSGNLKVNVDDKGDVTVYDGNLVFAPSNRSVPAGTYLILQYIMATNRFIVLNSKKLDLMVYGTAWGESDEVVRTVILDSAQDFSTSTNNFLFCFNFENSNNAVGLKLKIGSSEYPVTYGGVPIIPGQIQGGQNYLFRHTPVRTSIEILNPSVNVTTEGLKVYKGTAVLNSVGYWDGEVVTENGDFTGQDGDLLLIMTGEIVTPFTYLSVDGVQLKLSYGNRTNKSIFADAGFRLPNNSFCWFKVKFEQNYTMIFAEVISPVRQLAPHIYICGTPADDPKKVIYDYTLDIPIQLSTSGMYPMIAVMFEFGNTAENVVLEIRRGDGQVILSGNVIMRTKAPDIEWSMRAKSFHFPARGEVCFFFLSGDAYLVNPVNTAAETKILQSLINTTEMAKSATINNANPLDSSIRQLSLYGSISQSGTPSRANPIYPTGTVDPYIEINGTRITFPGLTLYGFEGVSEARDILEYKDGRLLLYRYVIVQEYSASLTVGIPSGSTSSFYIDVRESNADIFMYLNSHFPVLQWSAGLSHEFTSAAQGRASFYNTNSYIDPHNTATIRAYFESQKTNGTPMIMYMRRSYTYGSIPQDVTSQFASQVQALNQLLIPRPANITSNADFELTYNLDADGGITQLNKTLTQFLGGTV